MAGSNQPKDSAIAPLQALKKTVFLGLSGGVDSAVSAVLLKEQGYRVVGAYMKNWTRDLPGMKCPWAEDLADAKRVATKLKIDFEVFDFETDYKTRVVDYMIKEFAAGRTPNPDIMCNQEIKFNLFYHLATSAGADFIATGHYARTDGKALLRAVDDNKDQTYFLYRIPNEALRHTLFPVGNYLKPEIKQLASKHGLHVATKKESMGVCFVGEVGIKDFLKTFLPSTPGPIIDADNHSTLGYHDGVNYYTIGQRHGLGVGGGLPYYVVSKDLDTNTLYVSKNLRHDNLWATSLDLTDLVWRVGTKPQTTDLLVRLRHRASLLPAKLTKNQLIFPTPIKRPAPGQSAVFYDDTSCLGGGIIS